MARMRPQGQLPPWGPGCILFVQLVTQQSVPKGCTTIGTHESTPIPDPPFKAILKTVHDLPDLRIGQCYTNQALLIVQQVTGQASTQHGSWPNTFVLILILCSYAAPLSPLHGLCVCRWRLGQISLWFSGHPCTQGIAVRMHVPSRRFVGTYRTRGQQCLLLLLMMKTGETADSLRKDRALQAC